MALSNQESYWPLQNTFLYFSFLRLVFHSWPFEKFPFKDLFNSPGWGSLWYQNRKQLFPSSVVPRQKVTIPNACHLKKRRFIHLGQSVLWLQRLSVQAMNGSGDLILLVNFWDSSKLFKLLHRLLALLVSDHQGHWEKGLKTGSAYLKIKAHHTWTWKLERKLPSSQDKPSTKSGAVDQSTSALITHLMFCEVVWLHLSIMSPTRAADGMSYFSGLWQCVKLEIGFPWNVVCS